MYVFLGYAAQAQFDGYLSTFDQTMGQFWSLTDSKIIDVKPGRLATRTTSSQGSLRQAPQRPACLRKKGKRWPS